MRNDVTANQIRPAERLGFVVVVDELALNHRFTAPIEPFRPRRALQTGAHLLQHRAIDIEIVGMQVGNDVARGHAHAFVHGIGDAAAHVVQNFHITAHRTDHVERGIFGAAVNENPLDFNILLGIDRGNTLGEPFRAIPGAGND